MIAAAPLARTRALVARREATSWVVLGSLATVSVVVRVVLAHWHTSPRYFPDEYIYAALSRSLAHGQLAVRGEPAHFYAILQPLLAAPLWRFFPVETAYRLVQVENAIAASLVVVPLWFLGRELGLGRRAIHLVCVYALAVPMLAMLPVTISDFVAYPLAVGGVAAAVRSLNEPSRKRQLVFLAVALLATLGRIQYFVLVPAYLVGALALDRRESVRRHPLVFVSILPAAGVVALAATGFYSFGADTLDHAIVTWLPLHAFILAAIAGAVIVPGAVAALLRPENRVQAAFSWVTITTILLTIAQASVYAAPEGRFKERYVFALLPLLAVAFAVYVRNRRPHGLIVLVVAAALIGAAAELPFSAYDELAPLYDAQSMIAAWLLQQHLGASGSSAVIAILISAGAALAVAIARWRRVAVVALPLAILGAAATTAAARYVDIHDNHRAVDPVWIETATGGARVTAIATPGSDRFDLSRVLYWNRSVDRELVLDSGEGTDVYATHRLTVAHDGTLEGVKGYFLFDRGGTQATFAGATRVARHGRFELLRTSGVPHFRLLAENVTPAGWLAPFARLQAWSAGPRPRVRFTLSLPATATQPAHLWLGLQPFVVRPGARLSVACASKAWPVKVLFVSREARSGRLEAPASVRLTDMRIAPGGPRVERALSCSAAPPRR